LAESGEGNFARARELALKELDAAGEDAAKAQDAKHVIAQIEERLDLKVKQARWMLENGYPIEAGEAIDKLGKSVKGWEERENQLGGLRRGARDARDEA
jgi:hypothetical protein